MVIAIQIPAPTENPHICNSSSGGIPPRVFRDEFRASVITRTVTKAASTFFSVNPINNAEFYLHSHGNILIPGELGPVVQQFPQSLKHSSLKGSPLRGKANNPREPKST